MAFEINSSLLRTIIIFLVLVIAYFILSSFLKRYFLTKAHTKKAKHNVIVFMNIVTYLFVILSLIFLLLSYTGSLTGIGLTAGLLTAALGWALQRPITGMAAWIMIITTKPFTIGDRIVIGSVRGEVINITITHIYLGEIGGTVVGDDPSGRIIIVPNAVMFEQNVINYTAQDEYVLDEVVFTVTYSSDLELAKRIAKESANDITKEFAGKVLTDPFIRTAFQASGVDVKIRYYTPASKRQIIQSDITEEIFKRIMKEKKVEFAYLHTQVILDKKK